MNRPLISICIPNFNNSKYLDFCIQSVLDQTYKNIEIILVDDCSSDGSINIAQKYRNNIKIYINSVNIGQPKNTNKCVELSRGEYIVILHSDDLLLPDFISKLLPLLEKYPNVGMAAGERMITDEANRRKPIKPFYKYNCIVPGIKQAKVFMMTSFLPCQVLLRRKIFNQIGGIDERHTVNLDGLLWFKCSLVRDLAYIQNPVCAYRTHKNQTTAKYNKTFDHMIEYYNTLKEMLAMAQGIPYLKRFSQIAIKRVGELTVRYCDEVMKNQNYDLAKRYLALATVFDPEVSNLKQYKIIKQSLQSKKEDPWIRYNKLKGFIDINIRKFSYDPPLGSLKL